MKYYKFILFLCFCFHSNFLANAAQEVQNGYVKCWHIREIEQEETTKAIYIDFKKEIEDDDYLKDNNHLNFCKCKLIKDITWNPDPEVLAGKISLYNGKISDLYINNVNKPSHLNYSIKFYSEIFNSNSEIKPMFFPGRQTRKSWQDHVDEIRDDMDNQRYEAINDYINNILQNQQDEEYNSD